jgi:hypothetical protein
MPRRQPTKNPRLPEGFLRSRQMFHVNHQAAMDTVLKVLCALLLDWPL